MLHYGAATLFAAVDRLWDVWHYCISALVSFFRRLEEEDSMIGSFEWVMSENAGIRLFPKPGPMISWQPQWCQDNDSSRF